MSKRTPLTLTIKITPATEWQENTILPMLKATLRAIAISVTSWHKGNVFEGSIKPDSTDNCYLDYVDGYLTCTFNHKSGEECLMHERP